MKKTHYILSLLILWSGVLFANDIQVTAAVSKNQVAAGEQFEVTFSINGNADRFNPPNFSGFQVLSGPNQSSSMTSINGTTTVSMSLSYDLVAVKEGTYTIGPATVIVNGQQLKSNSLKITVKGKAASQNNAATAPDADRSSSGKPENISKSLFIRAIPSKTSLFQGEQLTVTYKLYTNASLVDNQLEKLPDFNGFWSQEIKDNNTNIPWETETYNGSRYNTAVLRKIILFPEHSGNLSLDPLIMTFLVRQTEPSNDPFDQIFGGSYKDVKYKIKSTLVTIHVKPLPEAGKPIGFQGAVGNFALSAAVDKKDLRANEALNYTLKISGSGNLKLLNAPNVTFPPDFEKYDPKLTDHISESLTGVSGSREYTYLLIPRHEGDYTLEPYRFSYFNPATQRYITLASGSFPIKVAKGAPGSNVTAYPSENQQDIKTLGKDILYIKTSSSLAKDGEGFYGSVLYFVLLCFGPLLFILALVYKKWNEQHNSDLVKIKSRNANKVAAKHLANAKKQLSTGDKKAFYEGVYKGLYGYLSDKLNIPAAHLNQENIVAGLKAISLDENVIKSLVETLEMCEMARYAPVSGTAKEEVFEKAKSIINDIENKA